MSCLTLNCFKILGALFAQSRWYILGRHDSINCLCISFCMGLLLTPKPDSNRKLICLSVSSPDMEDFAAFSFLYTVVRLRNFEFF